MSGTPAQTANGLALALITPFVRVSEPLDSPSGSAMATTAAGLTAPPTTGVDSGSSGLYTTADARRTWLGILTYVVLTAGLSSILWSLMMARHTLRVGGSAGVLALMWCPAIAGFITRLLFQRTLRGVGWRLGAARYEWAGYWIPIAYASAVYVPLWIGGYADFSKLPAKIMSIDLSGLPTPVAFLGYLLVLTTVGLLFDSFAALGEELGWRGFLVPELAKVTSFGRLGALSGIIWATWHIPLILAADYHGANPPWYSTICFVVMVVAMGYVIAWLRLRSGSVWPAMLLHASHNLFVQALFDPLTRSTPFTNYYIGEFGAGLAIAVVVVALMIWRRRGELREQGVRV
jgi:membrane protease YdiL (CAAX protease family)